jgi:predicted transcriptional regulator
VSNKEVKSVEKQINCLACGKPIKKLKRYYRNGKFYCSKKCWRKSKESKEAKK